MIIRIATLACFLLLASFSQCNAEIVLGNEFNGDINGNTDGASLYTLGQVTAANIFSAGVGRVGYTRNGGNGALVAGELRTSNGSFNFGTRYFSFDISPTNGATVNLENFEYAGSQNISGGTNGATKFDFRSSLDNYTASIPGASLTGGIINLGAGFQGIAAPTEFRLFIQSDFAGESSNSTYSLDRFVFNGTVSAVPEPSSALMFTMAGLGLLVRRKRQSK